LEGPLDHRAVGAEVGLWQADATVS